MLLVSFHVRDKAGNGFKFYLDYAKRVSRNCFLEAKHYKFFDEADEKVVVEFSKLMQQTFVSMFTTSKLWGFVVDSVFDASVLLDFPISGNQSEKDTVPNQTLKGPATVSCADILLLAAGEGIHLAGGPYYPLTTGRRDSLLSFPEIRASKIPSLNDDLSKNITLFASKGFNERETVSLLGAHNIGKVHCHFFRNRLHNISGTGLPDPALDPGTLNLMRSRCDNSYDQTEEPSINMDSEGAPEPEFGTHYYKNLVQGKGILHADQQLMASEESASLVEIYASDGSLFRQKFARAMMKLLNLRVLTRPLG
ncbi:Peroxidase [Thalictrum thalictroides]|uniref:Peroxidase n=1 Tax=Thalictrum thalictroides TaxID=46969 RepID=A0A7J6VVD3_THATH|nr:Peroxidase [Thalictrum thalictroides]